MKREPMARPWTEVDRERHELLEVLLFPVLMAVILFALAFTTPVPQ